VSPIRSKGVSMQKETVSIRVPATVANFGGAGGSAAMALDASLNLKVTRRTDGRVCIRYFGENGDRVPRDRSNLVVSSLEAALHWKGGEFLGADIEIYSSIPVAVGLGASTAAILAGFMAANELYRLGMEENTLLNVAGIYEPRKANLRAAWLGGIVGSLTSSDVETDMALLHQTTPASEDYVLSVVVPDIENGVALAGLEEVLKVKVEGEGSVFVCGSGPAVATYSRIGAAARDIREIFARHGLKSSTFAFHPTNSGAREWNISKKAETPSIHSESPFRETIMV